MTYSGQNSILYWGNEGTKGAGAPGSDQNIPCNPMASHVPQKPRYVDEEFRTFDSLEPKYVQTTELAPGEGPFEGLFFDPFMLLTFFTHKTVGGTWAAGTGTITADFTAVDDVDTIFAQSRIYDHSSTSNHVDKLLKYGLPMKYAWIFEKGKFMKERAEYKFLDFSTAYTAPTINNSFHDQAWGSGVGGWAGWDNSGCGGSGKRSPINSELTWGGAALTGLNITGGEISWETGYESAQTISSLVHSQDWRMPRNYVVNLKGFLNDLTLITEWEKAFKDRTSQTFQYAYDATVDQEKYIQWTNAYISPESTIASIPESGKPVEVDIIIKGGESTALSYSGKFLNLADPTALITTSP